MIHFVYDGEFRRILLKITAGSKWLTEFIQILMESGNDFYMVQESAAKPLSHDVQKSLIRKTYIESKKEIFLFENRWFGEIW